MARVSLENNREQNGLGEDLDIDTDAKIENKSAVCKALWQKPTLSRKQYKTKIWSYLNIKYLENWQESILKIEDINM